VGRSAIGFGYVVYQSFTSYSLFLSGKQSINQSSLENAPLAHQHAINMVVPFLCGQKYTLPQRRGGKKAFATSET
jgi:hypothetical protein